MNVRKAIALLVTGADLTEDDAYSVFTQLVEGETTPAQIGSLLTAMHVKGEVVSEIAGAARAMREMATSVKVSGDVIDTCGTGGDGCNTFNISTCAAFVVSAAGLCVAKHGNRAMSGKVGGADLLEELGAKIEMTAGEVGLCMREVGFGFMFAPAFHRSMRHAVGPRKEVGIRTIFNLLGPLTNPAGARHQLVGVFDARWVVPLAQALGRLHCRRALVVHGEDDGLDEVSLSGKTHVAEWTGERVKTYMLEPGDFGIPRSPLAALQVDSARESAKIVRSVLRGERGPARDVVVLNAGIALYTGFAVRSVQEGVSLASSTIDGGAADQKLKDYIRISNKGTL